MTSIVADVAELTERIAADFSTEYRRVQALGRRFTVALSGGSVATTFFPRLASLALDWSRCDFFWADERAVAPDDPESNFGVARKLWFDAAGVPAASIHRMIAEEHDDLDAAAARYAEILTAIADEPPRLDYVILGVGPDGHVASLFPGHALLAETRRSVVGVNDSPKPPPHRLTLTMPVLTSASRVVVSAFGTSKAAVMHEAIADPRSALPVAIVLRQAPRALVLLDRAAGQVS